MNKYFKAFLHRGALFGGFGPIIVGIVFFILSLTIDNFYLTGGEIFLAIASTYILAFVQAGASVFNQIEHWSLGRSFLCHFLTLYLAYSVCYTVNSWIPFEPLMLVFFTAIFAVSYLIIWLSVYFSVKATQKRLNSKIK